MFLVTHQIIKNVGGDPLEVPLVHHGAQRRLVVHNAGKWCTT